MVEHFKRSSQAYTKLKNTQKQMGYTELKLIQDVSTRWNSTYDMFQRCINIKEPLISTIAVLGNIENLSQDDFDVMQHYCDIFKPFKEITTELSSEKSVSISKVLILTNVLLSHIKVKFNDIKLPEIIHTMLSKMVTKAEKKFRGIEDQPVLTETTLLDPRFKKKGFKNNIVYQRTYDRVIQQMTGFIQSKNQKDVVQTETQEHEEGNNDNRYEIEAVDIWKQFDSQVKFNYIF